MISLITSSTTDGPLVFVGELMSYLLYLCLFGYNGFHHMLCFILSVFALSTLCYQFRWNVCFY
jgi:hypothetical protein